MSSIVFKPQVTTLTPRPRVTRAILRTTAHTLVIRGGLKGPAGSPDTAAQIKAKLETLTEDSRLDAAAIKNLPSGGDLPADLCRISLDETSTFVILSTLDGTPFAKLIFEPPDE